MDRLMTPFWVAALAALVLWGCGEPPPEPPAPAKPAPTPSAPPAAETLPPPARPWPFEGQEPALAELAQDPLAKNYLLIFDGSGSMDKTDCSAPRRKIDVAKEAVVAWSRSVPADANLGLYAFHNTGRTVLPLGTDNREAFTRSVQQVTAGGKTPLSEAVSHAFAELTRQARRQLGYGEYTIVVVTDGIANNETLLAQRVAAVLARTPITIHSIGFCIGPQHALNLPGQTAYTAADNPTQLQQGLETVLAESESFDDSDFEN